jgi:hypothetical protein
MLTKKSNAFPNDETIIEWTNSYSSERLHAQKLIKHSILECPAIYKRARLARVRSGMGSESSDSFAK